MLIVASELKKALDTVKKGIATKGILPVLSHVLLEKIDGALAISATDLQVFYETKIAVDSSERDFKVTAAFSELYAFISKLKDEDVLVSLLDNEMELKAGRKKAKIVTSDAADFPRSPEKSDEFKPVYSTGEKAAFTESVKRVPFFAEDAAKTILTGVYVHSKNGKLNLASTDGYRLGVVNLESTNDFPAEMIIPGKPLHEMLAAVNKSDSEDLVVSAAKNHLKIESGTTTVYSRLIEGKYPPYEKILPLNFQRSMSVPVKELVDSIVLAREFASKQTKVVSLVLKPAFVGVSASDYGRDYEDEISADHFGEKANEEMRISFNADFLIQALKMIYSDNVKFNFNSEVQPVVIEDEFDANYRVMLMPIKP